MIFSLGRKETLRDKITPSLLTLLLSKIHFWSDMHDMRKILNKYGHYGDIRVSGEDDGKK